MLFPGLGNQYVALAAWDSQLTAQAITAERPDNLYRPADSDLDAGAHGIFDHKAGGFFDPSFIGRLPTTARTFAMALARTAKEKRTTDQAIATQKRGQYQ